MKDARILTSSAGSTAGRGSSTERNLRTSTTENASRGIASPQGTARKGTAPPLWSFSASFREKPWNLCNAFILFVLFSIQALSPWLTKGTLLHCDWSLSCRDVKYNIRPCVEDLIILPSPRCRGPLPPHARPGYRERERERDLREKDRSGSRDREDHYGRPPYDRPPYERSGPERYSHGASPYGTLKCPRC